MQADFDHAPGHRADIANLGEIEAERSPLEPRHRAGQRIAHRARGQPAAIGQIEFADPENIARPVIGDDPAFGDARHHIALRVAADQPLRHRGAQMLAAIGQAQAFGVKPVFLADIGDIDHPVVDRAGRTGGQSQRREQRGEQGEGAEHLRQRVSSTRAARQHGNAGEAIRSCAAGRVRPSAGPERDGRANSAAIRCCRPKRGRAPSWDRSRFRRRCRNVRPAPRRPSP